MIRLFTAIFAAAAIAASAVVLGLAPVSANTPADVGVQQPAMKADRQAAGAPAACTSRAWPYASDCTFAARWQGERRPVRLVTTDRLPRQ